MSFNIIAESSTTLNYSGLHSKIFREGLPFDLIPMPGLGIDGGDAIGICIPSKSATIETSRILKPILKVLKSAGCDIYDLYGGQKLGLFNYKTLEKNLIS